MDEVSSLIQYTDETGLSVDVNVQHETAWMTQKGMAELFGVTVPTISFHLKNIFESRELDENSVIRNIRITAADGKSYPTQVYNLDAIISVGYRVNSQRATKFRIWATQVLTQYVRDGYVINERLLREDPKKLSELAAKLRELRANEKNVFASVRECFKLAASDYEPTSQEVKTFYALLQDKFHHAVTRMTSSKLILDRANHADERMGLQHTANHLPTLQEAKVGKNYLREEELYRLHLLSEQFLLYAESTALRGENMTMRQLHEQLDRLLALNGYPVFEGYRDYLKDEAMAHAEQEYQHYLDIRKLEMLGVKVDLEDFYAGEYENYREEMNKIGPQQLRQHLARALTVREEALAAAPSE